MINIAHESQHWHRGGTCENTVSKKDCGLNHLRLGREAAFPYYVTNKNCVSTHLKTQSTTTTGNQTRRAASRRVRGQTWWWVQQPAPTKRHNWQHWRSQVVRTAPCTTAESNVHREKARDPFNPDSNSELSSRTNPREQRTGLTNAKDSSVTPNTNKLKVKNQHQQKSKRNDREPIEEATLTQPPRRDPRTKGPQTSKTHP